MMPPAEQIIHPDPVKIAGMRILILAIALLSLTAYAAEYKPLVGSYSIAGKTLYDPPANEAHNTHIYFSLDGKAARDLYESMKTKAIPNACTDDGSLSKRAGEMQCTRSKDGKEYQCWFGIDLRTQKIVNGAIC